VLEFLRDMTAIRHSGTIRLPISPMERYDANDYGPLRSLHEISLDIATSLSLQWLRFCFKLCDRAEKLDNAGRI
jgi:hypothetical protein